MDFSRQWLAGLGIDPDKVDTIVKAHGAIVGSILDERDKLQQEVNEAAELQKQLEVLQSEKNDLQKQYDDEHKAFEDFKAEAATEGVKRAKSAVYRDALRKANIPEQVVDDLLKIAPVDSVNLGEDGKPTNMGDIEKGIKDKFSAYIRTESTKLDTPETPPSGGTGKDAFEAMSLMDKMRYANEHPAEAAAFMNP